MLLAGALGAEPLAWERVPAPLAAILRDGGLTGATFPDWLAKHREGSARRLAEGTAEHIAYYLLQTKEFDAGPPLQPMAEARKYAAEGAISAAVRRRMDWFYAVRPVSERHRVLRAAAEGLGWTPERVVESAFRFLLQMAKTEDADALYQSRGLSADPYPPTMRAVERGLIWLRANRPGERGAVLLLGPGAEFGSRFGVDDAKPVLSPQPRALLDLLGRTAVFDCVDIRAEVVASLEKGPCRASTGDVAADALPAAKYDLVVATNLFVYLDSTELALAFANVAGALRPGGCLIHNDARFAARLFGEAAGMPALHFEKVTLGIQNETELIDRIVVHCKSAATP